MSLKTLTDLRPLAGRLIDFQVRALPAEESVLRGRILRVSDFSDGPVVYINHVFTFDAMSRQWLPFKPPDVTLDLRPIEGHSIYLPPIEMQDGSVEIVLLDGRSAVIHGDGSSPEKYPLLVSFSFQNFLESIY